MNNSVSNVVVPLHITSQSDQKLSLEGDGAPIPDKVKGGPDLGSLLGPFGQDSPKIFLLNETEQGSPSLFDDRSVTPTSSTVDVVHEQQCNPPASKHLVVEVPSSTLLAPRSCFEPFDPGLPIVSEREALKILETTHKTAASAIESGEYQLEDFAIYRDTAHNALEMAALDKLDTRRGHENCFFDGVLRNDSTRLFVKRVAIVALPIGNHGSIAEHTVRGNIWVSSALSRARNIYYKLGQPAREYARFYHPFLWVADLAKHFVDFLLVLGRRKRSATIHHFRSLFATWLRKIHKNAPAFDAWLAQYPRSDFRSAVAANISFLHKEAVGVLGERQAYWHDIWVETWKFSRYKPLARPQIDTHYTVVTQYIFDSFSHLPFGDRLYSIRLNPVAQKLHDRVTSTWHWENPKPLTRITDQHTKVRDVKPGDTISTPRDTATSGTSWQREVPAGFDDVDRWFGLVLKVHTNANNKRSFDVIWYYRPVDTLCGIMKYPWRNELFLSDHCSCDDRPKIKEDEVLGVHSVEFGGSPSSTSEFFCRQIYLSADRSWVTLNASHLSCIHNNPRAVVPSFQVGDTVLVHINLADSVSEPCEIVGSSSEGGKILYQLRRLPRRQLSDRIGGQTCAPNELVYTNQFTEVGSHRILGTCAVRFFDLAEEIPTPYDRNGVGSFFFITHQEIHTTEGPEYRPLDDIPSTLRQGFDPSLEAPKLRGLDLFCGGGNFGRGLEDGGAVEMKWANDYNAAALHTYMANADPAVMSPFLGSIDDLQYMAMQAKYSRSVPRIGDVDFISAGSPCPGFSRVTNDKTTLAQRKNQSLVAAFASFVDLYRPKYALLENVTGIVQKQSNRDQDVFSQLICAMVGLGYQARFFFLDASSCGSPQRRSRVFLVVAAPGVSLPSKPQQTHSHPDFTRSLGLGKLPNGQSMAEREMLRATPFKYVTAEKATADLPPLYDAKPDICVAFPDHRISIGITTTLRARMTLIPTRPYGYTFAKAWFGPERKQAGAGILTPSERELFPQETKSLCMKAGSSAYGRQYPNRLLETVTTKMHPGDAKCGRALHWREPRVLSIMEGRRAQGFRDDDVILGLPSEQSKIVGNSVAREVAVALGCVIREAWARSQPVQPEVLTDQDTDVDEEDDGMLLDDASDRTESPPWPSSYQHTPDTVTTDVSTCTANGVKRSSIVVEIYASKTARTERNSAPRREHIEMS